VIGQDLVQPCGLLLDLGDRFCRLGHLVAERLAVRLRLLGSPERLRAVGVRVGRPRSPSGWRSRPARPSAMTSPASCAPAWSTRWSKPGSRCRRWPRASWSPPAQTAPASRLPNSSIVRGGPCSRAAQLARAPRRSPGLVPGSGGDGRLAGPAWAAPAPGRRPCRWWIRACAHASSASYPHPPTSGHGSSARRYRAARLSHPGGGSTADRPRRRGSRTGRGPRRTW
jgi:hypothetical protein